MAERGRLREARVETREREPSKSAARGRSARSKKARLNSDRLATEAAERGRRGRATESQRSDRRPATDRPPTKRAGGRRAWEGGARRNKMGGSGRDGRASVGTRTERDTRRSGAIAVGGAGRGATRERHKRRPTKRTRRAAHGRAGQGATQIHKGKYSSLWLGVSHLRASSLEIYSGVTATAKGFHKGKFTFVNSCLQISLYKLIFSYVNRRLHL